MSEPRFEASAEDAQLVELSRTALDEFRNAFGVEFSLWKKQPRWECIDRNGTPAGSDFAETDADALASLLTAACADDQCQVRAEQNGTLVVVPLPTANQHQESLPQIVAVGLVSSPDGDLLRRQAELTLRLLQERQNNQRLEELADSYALQVSNNFEELHWLRSMAEHIQYCGVDNPLSTVAEKVLPSLCELVKAESLLFVPLMSADPEFDEEPTIAGNEYVDLAQCHAVIEKCKDLALKRPVVYNDDFQQNCIATHESPFRSFALVPVRSDSFHVGWLFACRQRGEDHVEIGPVPHEVYEDSIGTTEAGLLAAAGSLLATHARNIELYSEQQHLLTGVIRALVNAIDAKDSYTSGHSNRVGLMARRLAEQLRLPEEECEQAYMTGLLHDVGKIGIPDEVLLKEGKLTDEEFDVIKQHPAIGYSMLKHLKPLEYALPGILHHHERYDGAGYPMQLAEEDIPLIGRILAVVDSYDAMTSNRSYRSAMAFEKAESILLDNAGSQWDPDIVESFFAVLNDIHDICDPRGKKPTELAVAAAINAGLAHSANDEPQP